MTEVLAHVRIPDGGAKTLRATPRYGLRPVVGLALAGLALLIALVAQGMLADRATPWDSALLFLLAAYVWLRAVRVSWPEGGEIHGWRASTVDRAALRAPRYLAYAVGLGVLAWVLLEPKSFTNSGFIAWVASLYFLILAVHGPPRPDLRHVRDSLARVGTRGISLHMNPLVLALAALVAVTLLFRLYQLSSVPSDVTSDHMEKLLDVRDVLQGKAPVYFERNTGRELLEFYLAAPIAAVVGLKQLALQITMITVSLLAVLATFFLGRELLSTSFGLIAAAFMAVSRWDLTLARMGLRFEFTTLFSALTLLFLFRALRTQRAGEYLVCGLCLGLGLLGYSTFRVVPFLVLGLVALALYLASDVGSVERRPTLKGLALVFGMAMLVILPMARYVAANPTLFWERALSRAWTPGQTLPGNPVLLALDGLKNALLMFNFRGDVGWVHNVNQAPALEMAPAALFALGAAYVVVRFFREAEMWSGALLVGIPVLLLPSALSIAFPIENPSFNRASGAIPLVYIVVALVPGLAWSLIRRSLPGSAGSAGAFGLVLGLVAVAGAQSANLYFGDFARNYRQNVPNSGEMGAVAAGYARDLGGRDRVFIVSYPHWVDHRAVGMHMGDITWNNVLMQPEDLTRQAGQPAPRVYLVHPQDARAQTELRRLFPSGTMLRHISEIPGKDFLVYLVMGKG